MSVKIAEPSPGARTTPLSRRIRRRLGRTGLDVLAWVVVLFFFIPVLYMILTSIRPEIEVNATPAVWIPKTITFDAFAALFGGSTSNYSVPFGHYFRNSSIAAIGSTIVALVIGTFAGYAFARFRFRGKNGIFLGLMMSRAVPGIALGLPILIIFSNFPFGKMVPSWPGFSLLNTLPGLVLVYVAMNIPFTVWLMDGFFREIPPELDEAARIDGCNHWQAFTKVDLPLAAPGLGAAGIFSFLASWGEYAVATVVTRTVASKTFPVGLFDFTQEFTIDYRGMCAMAVVMLIPAVIFTLLIQRNLVRGLTFGAVK